MKNDKKMFFMIEAVLAVMVLLVVLAMLREKSGKDLDKISVILQDSEDNQWAAFKYGLEMAAADYGIEVFVVGTEGKMTLENERDLIAIEIAHGADAVIVQPVPGKDSREMLKKMEKKVPILLVEDGAVQPGETSGFAVVEPEHYEMGAALARELVEDYNGNLKGKTLGILTESEDSRAAQERIQGFCDGIKGRGVEIRWTEVQPSGEDQAYFLESRPKVDLVIAFDDDSLTNAGECASYNNLHGALVYGIGNSTEAFYYLDNKFIKCLIVPDEFNVGYQSLTEVAESLNRYFYKARGRTVSHTVIRRDTMFSKENQEILFTMSQ